MCSFVVWCGKMSCEHPVINGGFITVFSFYVLLCGILLCYVVICDLSIL